ncbi:putative cystathionine gamma-synthase [Colletotrichum shisoi]|uniref:Putative cystathionine gamma-synthase n=1 Tax=Colletotrichum shisoi TaxID=2078593 RepID=A0A5Q4C2N1_9PEZI|nr:putative cystathionine gamma-synthase [Colletotrichum shisoi]
MARIVHLYPRFGPFGPVARVLKAICAKIQTPEGHGALCFTSPVSFAAVRTHALHPHRKQHVLVERDLGYRCVDVGDVRLYLVTYPVPKTPGVIGAWQNPGFGVSIRLAEKLLRDLDSLKEVDLEADLPPPSTEYLPEREAHGKLRGRIAGLLRRAATDQENARAESKDVFLYPTGTATIAAVDRTIQEYRPGSVVHLAALDTSTSDRSTQRAWGVFESWLDEEFAAGKGVSYVFAEFPNNPLLASIDIGRLGKLVSADFSAGSFANIDVLSEADILVSSLTNTVLNPLSPQYPALSSLWYETYHNELYVGDAEVLLSNSDDYLPRTAILNRNAAAMAKHLRAHAKDPSTPVARVLYPSLLGDYEVYRAYLREPTPELPEPAAGCLMSVELSSVAAARAFYDRLAFYPGPHLGAHRTLSFAYNLLAFSKHPDEAAYHRSYGILEEVVRISAGLEDVQDLLDTLDDALVAAREAKDRLAEGRRTMEAAAGPGFAA